MKSPSQNARAFLLVSEMVDSRSMTPEEELKRLNKLIKQYETVYHTATDGDQRERVGKELKKLKSYRDKILAVNVIETEELEESADKADELEEYPILRSIIDEQESDRAQKRKMALHVDEQRTLSPSQHEVSRIALYTGYFEHEYIPFLTEMRLKLDFKFSMERDGFYGRFQDLTRKIADFDDEATRLAEGGYSKEIEMEVRKRTFKLKRILEVEVSRFFRSVKRFTGELIDDAHTDGVKCLNADSEIHFDKIEGKRLLEGVTVAEALDMLSSFAEEAISYLNVPEIESQENERADRY